MLTAVDFIVQAVIATNASSPENKSKNSTGTFVELRYSKNFLRLFFIISSLDEKNVYKFKVLMSLLIFNVFDSFFVLVDQINDFNVIITSFEIISFIINATIFGYLYNIYIQIKEIFGLYYFKKLGGGEKMKCFLKERQKFSTFICFNLILIITNYLSYDKSGDTAFPEKIFTLAAYFGCLFNIFLCVLEYLVFNEENFIIRKIFLTTYPIVIGCNIIELLSIFYTEKSWIDGGVIANIFLYSLFISFGTLFFAFKDFKNFDKGLKSVID